MSKKCPKCGFDVDPWGECVRCFKVDNRKDCDRIRTAILRDLQLMSPAQAVHKYRESFPALTVDVVRAIGKGVKRKNSVLSISQEKVKP